MSELQGNRIVSFDPANGAFKTYDLPTPVSAPRRFDPTSERFSEYALPVKGAVPYVARVDARRALILIGTSASDEVYAFDPRSGRFTVYPLPSRGVIVRHMVIDPRNGDIWLAYGASPGIPARVARLRP